MREGSKKEGQGEERREGEIESLEGEMEAEVMVRLGRRV